MLNGSAEHSATRSVVLVAAAKVLDGILKLFANPSYLVWREERGEIEIAKGLEKVDLPLL